MVKIEQSLFKRVLYFILDGNPVRELLHGSPAYAYIHKAKLWMHCAAYPLISCINVCVKAKHTIFMQPQYPVSCSGTKSAYNVDDKFYHGF